MSRRRPPGSGAGPAPRPGCGSSRGSDPELWRVAGDSIRSVNLATGRLRRTPGRSPTAPTAICAAATTSDTVAGAPRVAAPAAAASHTSRTCSGVRLNGGMLSTSSSDNVEIIDRHREVRPRSDSGSAVTTGGSHGSQFGCHACAPTTTTGTKASAVASKNARPTPAPVAGAKSGSASRRTMSARRVRVASRRQIRSRSVSPAPSATARYGTSSPAKAPAARATPAVPGADCT